MEIILLITEVQVVMCKEIVSYLIMRQQLIPNTMVGEVLRVVDNTALSNLVRAIEITANAGSNTSGTNTGIRTTGATFGIQAYN